MQQPDEMRSAERWQPPAEPSDEDMVVIGNPAVSGAGETQSPARAYPQEDQPYSPEDQPYVPEGQPYPPEGQPHSAADEQYPADDQPYPADDQPYPAEAGGASQPAGTDRRWSEILAMFVDDPRGSVKLAAGLVDQAVEDLVASVRQRQATLAAAWQDTDAGTEALRGALRDYRAFWAIVRRDMPAADTATLTPGATSPRPDTPRTRPDPGGTPFATYPRADGADEPERGRTPA